MREISSVGFILPSVGRILPSIKLVGKAQTLDATRMEDVRKGIERDGKREDRAFCEERRGRKAQDRPRKAQDVMTARRGTRSTTMKHKNTWKESPLRRERILQPGKPVYRNQVVCAGLGLME
jgi:hypothetical protein